MENEVLAQVSGDFRVGIQCGAKETAVGATELFIQFAQEPE